MSRWIVLTYEKLVTIALWVWVLIGGLTGAGIANAVGYSPPVQFLSLVLGAGTSFVAAAVMFGSGLILGEIYREIALLRNELARRHPEYLSNAYNLSTQNIRGDVSTGAAKAGQRADTAAARAEAYAGTATDAPTAMSREVADFAEAQEIIRNGNFDTIANKSVTRMSVYTGNLPNMYGALKIQYDDSSIDLRLGQLRRTFSKELYLIMAEKNTN